MDEQIRTEIAETGHGTRAVVVGGSIAGLLAARVLADHFDHVVVVERDAYPRSPAPRPGVPQAPHLHALLVRGLRIVEALFPGIGAELREAGAHPIDVGQEVAWLTPAGWGLPFRSGLEMLAFSRPLLDATLHRRVSALPNVALLEGYDVTGLVASKRRGAVAGLSLRRRGEGRGTGLATLDADLVVDASGRRSRAPDWLEALGYPRPAETVINAYLGYASRFFRAPAGHEERGWKAAFIQAAPPERKRGGVLFPVEGDRWLFTLVGGGRDYPPTDEAGFAAFVESLASPIFRDAVRDAEPVSAITGYRGTENRLRHFERMREWPEGLVVIGDALCAFNPVYGQGMTVAAMGAEALGEALAGRGGAAPLPRGFARRLQRRLAKVVALPWALATGEDCRYAETTGGSPGLAAKLMQRYVDAVVALTTRDAVVRRTWLAVFNMLEPPSRLFRPAIALRVARRALLEPPAKRARADSGATWAPSASTQQSLGSG